MRVTTIPPSDHAIREPAIHLPKVPLPVHSPSSGFLSDTLELMPYTRAGYATLCQWLHIPPGCQLVLQFVTIRSCSRRHY
jgi:hypothetical protein